MKTCLRLTLFVCLLLPTFLAAQEPVQMVSPCLAGSAFTIRIPVRVPDNTTVQYAWYRNDTLIEGTEAILLSSESKIFYTVPDSLAYGDNVVFHFMYRLSDELDCLNCWTASRKYAVSFLSDLSCNAGGIVGDEVDLDCKLSGGGGSIEGDEISDLSCKLSNGGGGIEGDEVPDFSCKLSSGGGSIEGDEVPDLSCKLSGGGGIIE